MRSILLASLSVLLLVTTGANAETPAPPPPPTGVMPGDDAMTCEQVSAEMLPYAQALMGAMQSSGLSDAAAAAQRRMAEAQNGPHLPSTATNAQDRQMMDNMNTSSQTFADQTAPLAQNPRLQRLMQMAQEKHCPGF